jgi:hypothetical protein
MKTKTKTILEFVAEARENHSINEIKLSRILNKVKDTNRVIGTISAYRCDKTLEENKANTLSFSNSAKSEGFGFVYLDGAWYETENEKVCEEVSLFFDTILDREDKLFEFLVATAKKYNQNGFVFRGANHEFGVYDKNGALGFSFANTRVDTELKFDSIYSKIRKGSHKGRNFVFEDVCRLPTAETMGYAYIRRALVKDLLEDTEVATAEDEVLECGEDNRVATPYKPRVHHHAHR